MICFPADTRRTPLLVRSIPRENRPYSNGRHEHTSGTPSGTPSSAPAANVRLVKRPALRRRQLLSLGLPEQSHVRREQRAVRVDLELGIVDVLRVDGRARPVGVRGVPRPSQPQGRRPLSRGQDGVHVVGAAAGRGGTVWAQGREARRASDDGPHPRKGTRAQSRHSTHHKGIETSIARGPRVSFFNSGRSSSWRTAPSNFSTMSPRQSATSSVPKASKSFRAPEYSKAARVGVEAARQRRGCRRRAPHVSERRAAHLCVQASRGPDSSRPRRAGRTRRSSAAESPGRSAARRRRRRTARRDGGRC